MAEWLPRREAGEGAAAFVGLELAGRAHDLVGRERAASELSKKLGAATGPSASTGAARGSIPYA